MAEFIRQQGALYKAVVNHDNDQIPHGGFSIYNEIILYRKTAVQENPCVSGISPYIPSTPPILLIAE